MDPNPDRGTSPVPSTTEQSSQLPFKPNSTSNLLDNAQPPAITPSPPCRPVEEAEEANLTPARQTFELRHATNISRPRSRTWRWPSWILHLPRLVPGWRSQVETEDNPRGGSNSPTACDEAHLPSTADWPEWRSSRLRFDLLLLQLISTMGIGGTILWLAQYSRVHDGFVRLGSPPAFISDNPDLMKAIWTQGWQYTTLPVSLMTLYRLSWDGVIAAIAERQPYVELMKVDGSPPEKTLLLDYRADWQVVAIYKAFKLGHWFLGLCMSMSIVLSLGVVPSIAFLFSTDAASHRYPVPFSYTSAIEYSAIRRPERRGPSSGTALEWAVVTSHGLLNAPSLPWTNGTSAYPTFSLKNDLPKPDSQEPIFITVDSTAYVVQPNCVTLQQDIDYKAVLVALPVPGISTVSLLIRGNDRNCSFQSDLLFNLRPLSKDFRPLAAKMYQTVGCQQTTNPKNKNGTRLTLALAKYTGDRDKGVHQVSNITVVSCRPEYWAVPGTLNVTMDTSYQNRTNEDKDNHNVPLATVAGFNGNWSRAVKHTDKDHIFIERLLLGEMAYDPALDIQVPTHSLARFAFELAILSDTNRRKDDDPPSPSALTRSLDNLLQRSYAAMAATMLTTPLPPATNDRDQIGYASISETRIVVQQGVAYFVISMLFIVAVLLSVIILHERHKPSALFEEPIGLFGVAAITQRSTHLKEEITRLTDDTRCRGRYREKALKDTKFMGTHWAFNSYKGYIRETSWGDG
ncbi:hypothetical protein V8F33_013252 [Rhypophila sp. PSN 637]